MPEAHQPAKQRRRFEARLAVFLEHALSDELERIEADEVSRRERAHRVIQTDLAGVVDVLGVGHPAVEQVDGIEDERHEQPVGDETRRVFHLHRHPAELLAKAHCIVQRGF